MVASIIVEQLVPEKEPASQSNAHNEVAVTVIKHSLIVGPHLSENLFTDHMVFYYMIWGSVVCCPASVILMGEGGKEKAWKYHVNKIIIMDT